MALSQEYLEQVIGAKDHDLALQEANREGHCISWAICDGALIIFDLDDPPAWIPERDEDGNSIPGGRRP